MAKLFNDWNARFYNSLQDKNAEAFWAELLYWVVLAAIFITVAVYRLYLSQLLTIRWRRWLSDVYFRDWLSDRTYYRLEVINPGGTDNPEQRIEQDCSTVRHADAQPDRQPAAAGDDAHHVRDRAVGAVGQLPAADLRRHRHPRLHDVGGDPVRGGWARG